MLDTINRQIAAGERGVLSKDNIEKLLKANLPPLPGSVFRVLELMRDPNISTLSLASAVGYDPLLAARLLRLANSSYYSRQKNVTTIQKAIDTIGTKALYDAVILGIAANTFSKEIEGSAVGRAVWEHSLAVALLARELTGILQMSGAENTFICGLLHDIGKFVLLKADPEGFKKISERNDVDEFLKSEEQLFGLTHVEIGVLLVKRWNLPDEISSVILHHHEPSKAHQTVCMAYVVHIADLIASINGYAPRPAKSFDASDQRISGFQSEATVVLGLTPTQVFDAWQKIQPDLQEIVNNFRGK